MEFRNAYLVGLTALEFRISRASETLRTAQYLYGKASSSEEPNLAKEVKRAETNLSKLREAKRKLTGEF